MNLMDMGSLTHDHIPYEISNLNLEFYNAMWCRMLNNILFCDPWN